MKFKNYLFGALFALLTFNAVAQTTHRITLNVDTGEITKQTVNQHANFGQADGVSNEDFTIEVNIGDYVEWVGVSSTSEDDEVEIVSINHQGGARVFAKNVLNGSNGIVVGKVTAGRAGDSEKYTVKFRVTVNGQRMPGVFIIDPKIVIKA